ncbi:protein kinase [Streptomyces sp. ISL-94]|uniref:protein kinase domain-containing protein n=1 Tax=Streptomyces sp. ISL-94 TaxID=2819190 RepID=UPI001BE5436E|nr:protein kinase [Streptomyces sp. ISL-94]MBT2478683.1 serine/threonine protein kinase [Streptomyces sp. ISL-94]
MIGPVGDTLGPGATLAGGRYRIDAKLGSGGMAVVFRAYDTKLARMVALKAMRTGLSFDDGYPARFRREAQAMAAISHPHVVAVHDMGDEPVPYIVMELVDGPSLADLLRARRALPVAQALDLASHVLAGLAVAHAHKLVHRDIKPGNVLLAADGTAKVADFGIARAAEGTGTALTRTGRLIGTPHFMSPEQVLGRSDIDGRSDLYSVGVMLFQMLAGRLPFEADSRYAIGYLHLTAPPPTLASLGIAAGPAVEAVLARALAKDPALRYPDAESMRAALQEPAPTALAQQPAFVPPRPPRPPRAVVPRGPLSRARRLLLAQALGLLAWLLGAQTDVGWLAVLGGFGSFVVGVPGLWLTCWAAGRRRGPLSRAFKIQTAVGMVIHGGVVLFFLTVIVVALAAPAGL